MKKRRRAPLQSGTVEFEIIGGLGERFLGACAEAGIPLREIRPTPTGFTAQVPLRAYKRLHRPARAARCRLRVRRRKGLSFLLAPYRGRMGIVWGLVLAAAVLGAQNNWIWSIDFYDFTAAEQRQLRAELYQRGIYEGAVADEQALQRAADEIFIASQAYSWVRLNFVHGRLVAEKVDCTPQPALVDDTVTDVVAISDGIVVRQVVVDGFALKKNGQSVAQGEVLISGTTIGSTGLQMYAHAMGEVYARVEKTYVYTQPWQTTAQVPTARVQRYSTLLLPGGGKLPLCRTAPPTTGWQQMVRTPVAPGGFALPATVETLEVRGVETCTVQRSASLAAAQARLAIYDAIAAEFGTYELQQQAETVRETADGLELTLQVTFVANIGKIVPFSGIT